MQKIKQRLDKELALLDLYLSIEKVRFLERLTINMHIDDDVLKAQVPSMLLQPLVENSIKYAVEPRKESGCITLIAKKENDRLVLQVLDNGDGKNTTDKSWFWYWDK